jgi:hypothetical protein
MARTEPADRFIHAWRYATHNKTGKKAIETRQFDRRDAIRDYTVVQGQKLHSMIDLHHRHSSRCCGIDGLAGVVE